MPKLWAATIAQHHEEVRSAICNAAVEVASERGVLAVTMAEIATRAGIGRATLYKYFSDVESVLVAWHTEAVEGHLAQLVRTIEASESKPDHALDELVRHHTEVLSAAHGADGPQLDGASVALAEAATSARRDVVELFTQVIEAAQRAGACRDDVSAAELARYAVSALDAATGATRPAARRVADLTLALLIQGPPD